MRHCFELMCLDGSRFGVGQVSCNEFMRNVHEKWLGNTEIVRTRLLVLEVLMLTFTRTEKNNDNRNRTLQEK